MSDIAFDIDPAGLGHLIFQRPENRNALTWAGMDRFARIIGQINERTTRHQSPELRALLVYGQGGSFCAGGDLEDVHSHAAKTDAEWMISKMGSALDQLEALPLPTIAAIEGAAFGGGAEIALACDFRVMGERSRMGWVQTSLGITTGWGGSQRLLRLIGYSKAVDCLMGSRIITASEAYRIGLAQRITAEGKAVEGGQELAYELIRYNPDVLRAVKEILLAGTYGEPGGASAKEREFFPELWISPAHQEAMRNVIARRDQD